VADWRHAKRIRLGDAPDLQPLESSDPEVSDSFDEAIREHLASIAAVAEGLDAAVRAYRQVSMLLEGELMREVARELDYRASQLARRQWRGIASVLPLALDRLTGCGYRRSRAGGTYVVTDAIFAFLYGLTKPQRGRMRSSLSLSRIPRPRYQRQQRGDGLLGCHPPARRGDVRSLGRGHARGRHHPTPLPQLGLEIRTAISTKSSRRGRHRPRLGNGLTARETTSPADGTVPLTGNEVSFTNNF